MQFAATSTPSSSSRFGAASADCASSDWMRLNPLWEAGVLELQKGVPTAPLSPSWRLLLLNDGYTTRNLAMITGGRILAHLIDSTTVDPADDNAPAAIAALDSPSLRRQVWLTTPAGDRLMYGVSWWNEHLFQAHLREPDQPIGQNLSLTRTELFREIQGLQLGTSPVLAEAFGTSRPLWGRHYLLWHQQQPLTLIYEVFSDQLTRYLGPSQLMAVAD